MIFLSQIKAILITRVTPGCAQVASRKKSNPSVKWATTRTIGESGYLACSRCLPMSLSARDRGRRRMAGYYRLLKLIAEFADCKDGSFVDLVNGITQAIEVSCQHALGLDSMLEWPLHGSFARDEIPLIHGVKKSAITKPGWGFRFAFACRSHGHVTFNIIPWHYSTLTQVISQVINPNGAIAYSSPVVRLRIMGRCADCNHCTQHRSINHATLLDMRLPVARSVHFR
jgi:hypothetical protein